MVAIATEVTAAHTRSAVRGAYTPLAVTGGCTMSGRRRLTVPGAGGPYPAQAGTGGGPKS